MLHRGQSCEGQEGSAEGDNDALLSLKGGEYDPSLPPLPSSSPSGPPFLSPLPSLSSSPTSPPSLQHSAEIHVLVFSTACCSAIAQLVLNDACSQLVVKVSYPFYVTFSC